jgi:hypothetical protein
MKAYLIFYNFASAVGWAYVLHLAIQCYLAGKTPTEAWAEFGQPLLIVQSTMAFEILHAMLGMVRSPVFVTALQVSSRLWVIWGATGVVKASQDHWSLYMMVIAWSFAEIPRYLFYLSNLALGSIPYPLFFIRYSAFMILYPVGITGEIFQLIESMSHWETAQPIWFRGIKLILIAYIPGSPFMINNMWMNRKSAFKKRNGGAAGGNKKPLSGLVWPVTNEKTQERASTQTNKAIWVAAAKAVDENIAMKAAKEKNWRYGYVKHVENNVRVSLVSSEAALKVASEGLKTAHDLFQFIRNDKTTSVKEAMDQYTKGIFDTVTIKGSGKKKGATNLTIPYAGQHGQPYYYSKSKRNNEISGKELLNQLNKWTTQGVIEADCAEAIKKCVENPEWLDLSDHFFVLLGAGSAMGPLPLLLALGANVIAVDIDRKPVWSKLIAMARESSGEFTFPVRSAKLENNEGKKLNTNKMSDDELASLAGADLLNDTPEIATWVSSVCPQQKVTVGNYTYLDGALHVQLSLACDAIISKVAEKRPDLALAFLCTPTDVHCVPKAAHQEMQDNFNKAPFWQKMFCPMLLAPNAIKPVKTSDTNKDIYLVDGIVAAQGPNYILAKRLQHWRSVVEWNRGHSISSNIAPSTATASVVHNAQFAAAYGGMHLFKPMEVMYAETSNAVMGALLIHDIRNEQAPCRGKGKNNNKTDDDLEVVNGLQIFKYGGFHGGTWRCGFKMGSIGELSALSFYLKTYFLQITTGMVMMMSVAMWLVTGKTAFF